jgi:hypothetical protein
MVKRILDATASDFRAIGKADLPESIHLAEGRTICAAPSAPGAEAL